MEFGWNPVVNDEAAFDIYPPYVALFRQEFSITDLNVARCTLSL